MKSYHNIETRKFPGREYRLGYGGGVTWRIYSQVDKWRKPYAWDAYATNSAKYFRTKTLAEMSKKLEQL